MSGIVSVSRTSSATLRTRRPQSIAGRRARTANPQNTGRASRPKRATEMKEPVSSGSSTINAPAAIHPLGTPAR